MKKSLFLLLLPTVLFVGGVCAQIPVNLADSFQICINNHIANNKDKGISAAIIMPNGGLWTGAAGVGKSSQPITTSTQFYCASTSKTFVAAGILQLIESGTININDSLWKYVVSSQYPAAYIDSTITIKQLLTHTSGIYNFTDNNTFYSSNFITNPSKKYKHNEGLTRFLTQGPTFPKGTSFEYSNSNYTLLALILEKAANSNLKDIINTKIIQPLNMTSTFSSDSATPNSNAGFWANIGLFDMNLSNTSHTALLTSMWGPAHLVSTPYDLVHYCRKLIKGQLYTNPTTITNMTTVDPFSIDVDGYGYGLGLERYKFAGGDLFGHTGNLGHITYMFHSPSDDYTIVTMTNRFAVGGSDNIKAFKELEKIVLRHLAFPLGIKNTNSESVFTIYPNPAKDKLTVKIAKNESSIISIYDIVGHELFQQQASSIENDIDITNLANGVYSVKIIQEGHTYTQKLIINK